jgi:hypothetical protein
MYPTGPMYSVVFTRFPPSHHGGVWVLPLISHNSKLTQNRGCVLGCPDWRVFVETKKKTSVGFLVFNTLCMYQCTRQEKINTVFAVIGTGSTLPSPSTNTIVMPPPPFPLCYYFFSRVWQVEILTILASRGGGGREVKSA